MQKIVTILRIIAISAVIGFSMTACRSGSSEPQKTITITEIPSIYDGKYGALMLFPPSASNYTVYSMDTISGTSFKFPLFDWKNDSRPWTGEGNYIIHIYIFEDITAATIGTYIYKGVINENTSIPDDPPDITLDWSSFTESGGTRTNLLHAFFQKR